MMRKGEASIKGQTVRICICIRKNMKKRSSEELIVITAVSDTNDKLKFSILFIFDLFYFYTVLDHYLNT